MVEVKEAEESSDAEPAEEQQQARRDAGSDTGQKSGGGGGKSEAEAEDRWINGRAGQADRRQPKKRGSERN